MKCPKCGKEYEGKFCPECGTPSGQASPAQNGPLPAGGTQFPAPSKKKGGCLKIALIVIGIFIVLGVLGTIFGEPSDSSDQSTPQSAPNTPSSASSAEPTPEPAPSYIEVSATDLLAAYDENTVSADNQYKGQLLKVTGTVGSIGKDILDDAYVTLTNDNEYSIISVQCYFAKDNLEGISTLKEGDVVTITGTCDGSSLNVILKGCNLVTE